jgi:hypothetical protein
VHEARRLDAADAGVEHPLDQRDLGGGVDQGVLVLQAVSRADLDDLHLHAVASRRSGGPAP